MSTKIMVSLHHSDHIVWSAYSEIPSEEARLLSQEELIKVGVLCGQAVRSILSRATASTFSPDDRPLVEEKPAKKSPRR